MQGKEIKEREREQKKNRNEVERSEEERLNEGTEMNDRVRKKEGGKEHKINIGIRTTKDS